MGFFAALLLLAQDGLPAANEPSALACTFASALRGQSCVYEAQPGGADPRDNSAAASEAGAAACAGAAKSADLRKKCERGVAEASLSPKCALQARLADPQGRLTADAAACVGALRAVISQTLFDGALGP